MTKKEVSAFVLTPGEYETCIDEVDATETAIRIHFLAYEPDGQPSEDVYENFDFRTNRSLALGEKVRAILNISKAEFAKKYDSDSLSEVAVKLEKDLVGREVQVKVAGTMIYHAEIENQPSTFTKHIVEIVGREEMKKE